MNKYIEHYDKYMSNVRIETERVVNLSGHDRGVLNTVYSNSRTHIDGMSTKMP